MNTLQQKLFNTLHWVDQNKRVVALGIATFMLFYAGVFYHHHREKQRIHAASMIYSKITDDYVTPKKSVQPALHLLDDYQDTVFYTYLKLYWAKEQVQNKQYHEAETTLSQLIPLAQEKYLEDLIRLRAARIQMMDRPQLALTTLYPITTWVHLIQRNQLQGDAYAKLHETTKALEKYQLALDNIQRDEQRFPGFGATYQQQRLIIEAAMHQLKKPSTSTSKKAPTP